MTHAATHNQMKYVFFLWLALPSNLDIRKGFCIDLRERLTTQKSSFCHAAILGKEPYILSRSYTWQGTIYSVTQLYLARNHIFCHAATLCEERLINEADVMRVFLTIFAVFSLESFAETFVVIFSVQWQTFSSVLTRPTATGCLSKECIVYCHSHTVL